jgi:two-component system NarL family response regulator
VSDKPLYGSSKLTPTEQRIVKLVARGLKNHEIGRRMHTSEHVVKNHLRSIFDKTGSFSRLELALWQLGAKARAKAKGAGA